MYYADTGIEDRKFGAREKSAQTNKQNKLTNKQTNKNKQINIAFKQANKTSQ